MILLDTHIWIWWVNGGEKLSEHQIEVLNENKFKEIAISIISVWEAAKLSEYGRLELDLSIKEWIYVAMEFKKIKIIDLTPEIILDSTSLPGNFHKDPADQLIVSTARIYNCPLLTSDRKILDYSFVDTIY